MTLQSFDRRTGSALRRLVWGLNPLEKALVLLGGIGGFIGGYVAAVLYIGLVGEVLQRLGLACK